MKDILAGIGANAVELSGTSLHGTVTPAKAGIQKILKSRDSGFRRNDAQGFNREILYHNSTKLGIGATGRSPLQQPLTRRLNWPRTSARLC